MNFRTVLAAAIFLAAAENVTASILVFEPSSQTVSGSFSVDVLIDDGVDLYAWNFDISFDGTILQATSVIEGAFLQTGGSTIFLQGTIDNSAGMISFIGDSLQGLIPGVSGTNGVLATVNFEIASYGVSPLGLSNILLLDSNLDEIESSGTAGSLTAVPEPGTGGLWVLGGLVLAACVARRKRAIAAAGLAAALGLVPASGRRYSNGPGGQHPDRGQSVGGLPDDLESQRDEFRQALHPRGRRSDLRPAAVLCKGSPSAASNGTWCTSRRATTRSMRSTRIRRAPPPRSGWRISGRTTRFRDGTPAWGSSALR